MARSPEETPPPPFEIFRARDAVDYQEGGPMFMAPMNEIEQAGMAAMHEAGMLEGGTVKLVYSRPGMSLTYCWFKSGYPLPLHSHSADCLYFIVAGSLKIGTEELGPGDGFFLGTDVPYAYVPGKEGVEVLEFRTSDSFDFRSLGKNGVYWGKAVANLVAARGNWPEETAPPSGMRVG
jgi:hypothetical protein